MKATELLDWPPEDRLRSTVGAVATLAFAAAVVATAGGTHPMGLAIQGLFVALAALNLAIGAPRLAAGVACVGLSGVLGSPYAPTLALTVLSWALLLAGLAAIVQVVRHGTAGGRIEAVTVAS